MTVPRDGVRIGVYICHCGRNIAGTVDVQALADFAGDLPHVVFTRPYKYMCSAPGTAFIRQDIVEHNLNRVVVAACSPLLHEKTFRRAAEEAGLNPYLLQVANVREHVAWVTKDKAHALLKAKAQLAGAVRRVANHELLDRKFVSITPRVLVVGGGIAGIQAALTLADAGKEVVLVERQATIGGHMAMLDKTFPTLDGAVHLLAPRMAAVKNHPGIRLLTLAEVSSVKGSVGRYEVTVKRNPRYVNEKSCVGCMECLEACLVKKPKVPDEFERSLGTRRPIYMPFAQAVPPVPVVDRESCLMLKSGECRQPCVEACGERSALNFNQTVRTEQFEVGAIIVATGFQTFDPTPMTHLGYGRFENIYTALEVERLLSPAGPTEGRLRLRDKSTPKRVGIVHCVGSRDHDYHTYCSRVCCMVSLKLAHQVRVRTGAEVYNFCIDIRASGKGFEEFYERVQKEGVSFIRGKVGGVSPAVDHGAGEERKELVVQVDDTLMNQARRVKVDMLILAHALEPSEDAVDVRRIFNMSCSTEGFFLEKHAKLAPVNTVNDGVFLAGACQGPKDIPDTVTQADAAAAQALALIDRGQVELEPNTAWVDEELCSGCKTCLGLCPYHAISRDPKRNVAAVDETLCKGCGTCVAGCPSGAILQHLFTDEQIYDEIEGIMSYV